MSKSIVMVTPATAEVEVNAQPITPGWVLEGAPQTRTRSLARSHDWLSSIVIWECTGGSFNWFYSKDEMLVIASGEAFIRPPGCEERLLRPGDFAYFPAGITCRWRVPEYVKKVAIVRETVWWPVGFSFKAFKKMLRLTHLAGDSPL